MYTVRTNCTTPTVKSFKSSVSGQLLLLPCQHWPLIKPHTENMKQCKSQSAHLFQGSGDDDLHHTVCLFVCLISLILLTDSSFYRSLAGQIIVSTCLPPSRMKVILHIWGGSALRKPASQGLFFWLHLKFDIFFILTPWLLVQAVDFNRFPEAIWALASSHEGHSADLLRRAALWKPASQGFFVWLHLQFWRLLHFYSVIVGAGRRFQSIPWSNWVLVYLQIIRFPL